MKPRWREAGVVVVIAALAGLVGGLACRPVEVDDERRKVMTSWGVDMLLPTYEFAATNASELATVAREFCGQPSAPGLVVLQTRWNQTRAAWKRTQVFAFGPYSEEPVRLGPKIDAWPARPQAVEDVLASSAVIDAHLLSTLGVFSRGLPALEYLLYGEQQDPLVLLSSDPRRCAYVIAAALDVADRVRELRSNWDPAAGDYLSELTEAGRTSESFDSLHTALGEVVNRMGFLVEDIRADKLGRPLGTTGGSGPQPNKVESLFSGRAGQDIRDNLAGLERLYFGGGPSDALGLDHYLQWRGHTFGQRMRERLDAADAALATMTLPLARAVVEQPEVVQGVIDELGRLQRLIQVDIINALSLTLTFNDNDGD